MKTSLSVEILERETPIERLIAETADAGFDGIELALTPDGPLTVESPEADCIQIAKRAAGADLEISAITVEGLRAAHLASPDPARRQTAYRYAIAALERAAWLGSGAVIIVPAVVATVDSSGVGSAPPGGAGHGSGASSTGGTPVPHAAARYEDAYALALEALLALRFEAERRGVRLACEHRWSRFLLSPLEMRDFVDRINSAWVGVCLDLATTAISGTPQDWIRTLGHRIVRVRLTDYTPCSEEPGVGRRCRLGEGDIDWPEVLASLRQAHYEGSVTCCEKGGLDDIAARLTRILRSAD